MALQRPRLRDRGLRIDDIRRDQLEESPDRFSPRPVLPKDTVVSVNPRLAGAWIVHSRGADYTKIRAAAGTGISPPDGLSSRLYQQPGAEARAQPQRGKPGSIMRSAAVTQMPRRRCSPYFYVDLIVAVGPSRVRAATRPTTSPTRARPASRAVTLRGGRVTTVGRPADLAGRIGHTPRSPTPRSLPSIRTMTRRRRSRSRPLLRRPAHSFFADRSVTSGRVTAFLQGNGRSTTLDVERR